MIDQHATHERPVVKQGCEIAIEFKLSLSDGTVVDEADVNNPLIFELGDGTLIHSLETLLEGLELGTSLKISLTPEEAFGFANPENIHSLQREEFPKDMVLQEGHVIGFTTPTGEEVPATVLQLDNQQVLMDFNHPLAGQTVVFEAKIVKVG